MFTQEQILEIKQRLRETSAKDTEFPLASLPLEGDEIITVVQGGENKKFPIDLFFESFSQYIDGSERVDFFNVSRYVQITKGYPEVARLTLPEAVENCPEDVRRPGQVITFMDNNDNWVTWQCNGEKKEQWLDIDYWKPLVKPEQEDVLLFDRIITEELPHIGATTNQTPNAIVYASFYKRFLAVVGTGDLATYYYAWPDYEKYTDTVHDNKPYDNKVYLSGGRTYVWDGTDLVAGGDEQIQSDWNQNDSSKKDFIKNKPTIPAEQIQSDWNQSNSQAKDFIKNKPTIPAPTTIDPVPTEDSPNAVASGGVYDALEEKQEKLVSGLNIKTINGQSIVGEGNLVTESDTMPFDGFILISPITIIDGSAVDPDAILYYRDVNRFVAKKGDKYYNNWADRLLYNNGNAPYTSKLYPYDGAVYTWDGTTFAATGGTSVRYDAQTLTTQQKEQAAQNIGLDSVVKGDVQQSLSDAQRIQAQNNMMGKAYSSVAADHSGLGKVYLAKNNGVLTQAMMQATNTVYVIQYDYTMNGNITVPAGCTLQFDGGSIGGGVIEGNNTTIIASKTTIFNDDASFGLTGTWNCKNIYSHWFKNAATDNHLCLLMKLANDNIENNIYIESGNYSVSRNANNEEGILIVPSNTNLYIDGTITLQPNAYDIYRIIRVNGKKNVLITGSGSIIGDKTTHTGTTGEMGHGVNIVNNSSNVVVRGLSISNMWGDCVTVGGSLDGTDIICTNICLENLTLDNGRRQGISIINAENVTITNCVITNVSGTTPQSGIDVEPNSNGVCKNIKILGCKFSGNAASDILVTSAASGTDYNSVKNVDIENCIGDNYLSMNKCSNVTAKNLQGMKIYVDYRIDNVVVRDSSFISINGSTTKTDNMVLDNCTINVPEDANVRCNLNNCRLFSNDSVHYIQAYNVYGCSFENIEARLSEGGAFEDITMKFSYNSTYAIQAINKVQLGDVSIDINNSTIYAPIFVNANKDVFVKSLYITGLVEPSHLAYLGAGSNLVVENYASTKKTKDGNGNLFLNYSPKIKDDVLIEYDNVKLGVRRSGTFANKPAAADIYVGFRYFCTDKQTTEGATDGIEILHKGNNVWVDALGRTVS